MDQPGRRRKGKGAGPETLAEGRTLEAGSLETKRRKEPSGAPGLRPPPYAPGTGARG